MKQTRQKKRKFHKIVILCTRKPNNRKISFLSQKIGIVKFVILMYIPKFSLGDCEGSAKSSLLNQLAEFRKFLMNQNS